MTAQTSAPQKMVETSETSTQTDVTATSETTTQTEVEKLAATSVTSTQTDPKSAQTLHKVRFHNGDSFSTPPRNVHPRTLGGRPPPLSADIYPYRFLTFYRSHERLGSSYYLKLMFALGLYASI